MNYKIVGRVMAGIIALEAVFMLPSVLLGFLDGNTRTALCFLFTMSGILLLAALLAFLCRNADRKFYAKEGLVCVGVSWVLMSLLGCIPFCASGEIPRFIDAFFEIVSGFTTTGASVVPDVEVLSRAVLYWRSFSHWLGGMGVLVFLLAVAPAANENGGFSLHLLRAESPGPVVGKLVPRMKQTAKILYLIYIGLTLLDFILLLCGGMSPFHAICTAFGTAGTGGFGTKADSIAGFSPYIQNVCTVFMLLFGVNFSVYYLLLLRQFKTAFKNEEVRFFFCTVAISIALITANIRPLYATFEETLRAAAFQVSSIISTTGFATADFNLWPAFSKAILLILMICGSCAGSTCGGIKCARMILLLKSVKRNISQTLHPNRVTLVRMDGQIMDEKVVSNTNLYLSAYFFILFGSFLAVSVGGTGLEENFTSVIACLNNIGPGLGFCGPAGNYAAFGVFPKLVLIFDMLVGRLEIFPILALLAGDRKLFRR